MKYVTFFCVFALMVGQASADGHGPAFGFSTATLGLGDTSIETGLMFRAGAVMIGPRVSYGVTPNFQVSVSAPVHLNHGEHPVGRFMSEMPGDPEAEVLGTWRFHHSLTGIGTRNESTLFLGMSATTQSLPRADGPPLNREPGYYAGAATGHVSRRFYAWAGAGYEHHGNWSTGDNDHQSDSALASLVVGWRPGFFDRDYPKPDLRVFWENTGEQIGRARRYNTPEVATGTTVIHEHDVTTTTAPATTTTPLGLVTLPDSGGTAVYSGPSILLTYRGVAFQSGLLYKMWSHVNGSQPNETYRVMFGVSYFFLGGK